MNPFEKIPEKEIQFFKEKVQRWLNVDTQISQLESQIRELKKVRNKELEPQITTFMTQYNVTDLNTDNGKLKCQERKTKKGLNKHNWQSNIHDQTYYYRGRAGQSGLNLMYLHCLRR